MSMISKLDEPDIRIGHLQIWVHGRQYPASQDYWDSNWLHVTAEYTGRGSRVMANGAFIRTDELNEFLGGLVVLDKELKGDASLKCMEPNLNVEVYAKSLGHMEMKTKLTADHMTESHEFTEQIDQTFLPPIIAGLKAVLTRYPMHDPDKVAH